MRLKERREVNGQSGPKVSKTEGFNCWALFQVRKAMGLPVNSPLFQSLGFGSTGSLGTGGSASA